MFKLGVQKVRPAWPALLNARASRLMAPPSACQRVTLKEEEVPITWGKEVAQGVGAANTTPGEMATPCSASFHLAEAARGERLGNWRGWRGGLGAPLVGRDGESRHAQRCIGEEADLFLVREPTEQV